LSLAKWREWIQEWRTDVQEGRLGRLWRDRVSRRTLVVAAGLQFFQQATGFNTLMYL
jgi:SP family myo-inositol transporter-like MFS transporter 13